MPDAQNAGAITITGMGDTLKRLNSLAKVDEEAGWVAKKLKQSLSESTTKHIIKPAKWRAKTFAAKVNTTKSGKVRNKRRQAGDAPLSNWNNAELKDQLGRVNNATALTRRDQVAARRSIRGSVVRETTTKHIAGAEIHGISRHGGWPLWNTTDVAAQIKLGRANKRRRNTGSNVYVGTVAVSARNASAAGAIAEIAGRANSNSTLAKNLTKKFGPASRLIWHEWDHGAEQEIRRDADVAVGQAAQDADRIMNRIGV